MVGNDHITFCPNSPGTAPVVLLCQFPIEEGQLLSFSSLCAFAGALHISACKNTPDANELTQRKTPLCKGCFGIALCKHLLLWQEPIATSLCPDDSEYPG